MEKVQQRLGVRRTSLGSLREAAQVFDAALLHEGIAALGARLAPSVPLAEQAALPPLTAIDGRLVPALPKLAWALWQDAQQRAAKMHGAFAVWRQVPVAVTVTAGTASARAELRRLVRLGGFDVLDRGSADDALCQERHDLPCSFLVRVQYNAAYEVQQALEVSTAAAAAGVSRDGLWRRLGTEHHTRLLPQPFRVVGLATDQTRPDGTPDRPVLVTNRLDWAAEVVALACRSRWAVARFFRWLKCVLGCRHWLSQSENGGSIHVYMALIASLLISGWGARRPNGPMRCCASLAVAGPVRPQSLRIFTSCIGELYHANLEPNSIAPQGDVAGRPWETLLGGAWHLESGPPDLDPGVRRDDMPPVHPCT